IITFSKELSGLTPSFAVFMRLDTMAPVAPQPSIAEIGDSGSYLFSYDPLSIGQDIFFQVDGGAHLAIGIRYQVGVISPSDVFLDKKVTEVDASVGALTAEVAGLP